MNDSIAAMLDARFRVEQETYRVMSLINQPISAPDAEQFYRVLPKVTNDLVHAHLSKARTALQEFETAALNAAALAKATRGKS